MSNFFRDMFYAVATGAIIGTAIRQRRERAVKHFLLIIQWCLVGPESKAMPTRSR